MAAKFRWVTEESEWAEEPAGEERLVRARPRWLTWLLLVVVAAAAGGLVYALFAWQMRRAVAAAEADVRQIHELLLNAVERQDVELFSTYLSGRDPQWADVLRERARRGLFYGLGPGIMWGPANVQIDAVTFSPGLDEATVRFTLQYYPLFNSSVPSSIHFQQTVVYRRGRDRWLLAPPAAEFWGEEVAFEGRWLTITYPERDTPVMERLAADLDAQVGEICTTAPAIACPAGLRLYVQLENDLVHWIELDGSSGPPISDRKIMLPAPSLVGWPGNEAAYRLLADWYGQVVTTGVVQLFTGYQSDHLISGTLPLEHRPLDQVISHPLPAPLPAGELVFVCRDDDLPQGELALNVYWLNLATGSWLHAYQRSYADGASGTLFPLPAGNGYAIQEFLEGELMTARLTFWRPGWELTVFEGTTNFDNALSQPAFTGQADPTGRYLVVRSNGSPPAFQLLDMRNCVVDNCPLLNMFAEPLWSPGGSWTLLQEPPDPLRWQTYRPLYRANERGQGRQAIGVGATPFWLDEEGYGYVRLDSQDEVELVVASVVDDAPQVWLRAADLLPVVPAERRWEGLTIWNVWPHPAETNTLALMTTPGRVQNAGPYDFFLVSWDEAAGRPAVTYLFAYEYPATADFSPDGRWLAFTSRGYVAHFQDLATGQVRVVSFDDGNWLGWSPDGRWFAQQGNEALLLTAPAYNYQVIARHDLTDCSLEQWTGDPLAAG
ncbi:MAG: hypothetical protein L0332_20350, partial [Chloroflexi bacterium]|nr:hypothetical protein [Chloroflexota bacterium]